MQGIDERFYVVRNMKVLDAFRCLKCGICRGTDETAKRHRQHCGEGGRYIGYKIQTFCLENGHTLKLRFSQCLLKTKMMRWKL